MGGRGTSSFSGGGGRTLPRSNVNWSGGIGTKVPETLKDAIGRRGRPLSVEKAYSGANPHFDDSRTYAEYNMNCQRCVVAYELRRRGYDVVAQPTYEGDVLPSVMVYRDKSGTIRTRDVWTQAFQHAKVTEVGASRNSTVEKNIVSAMRGFGSGSRAVVGVNWQGGGGHVFSIENRGGRIIAVDAQTGKRSSLGEALRGSVPTSTQITRTDNLRVSEKARLSVSTKRY